MMPRQHGLLFRRLARLRGLPQLGMDVARLEGDVEVAAQEELAAGGVDLVHEGLERLEEPDLGRIVAVAVGHVHGGDHPVAELAAVTMRVSMSNGGWTKAGGRGNVACRR